MMIVRLLTAGLLLAAAPVAAQKPAPAQAEAPTIDNAIWEGQAASGPIVHRESGVVLPETFGNFRRFRAGGLSSTDVFANYRSSRGGRDSIVTIFLFRPGTLPEHSLPVSVAAIGVRSPQAFLWSDGPFLTGSTPQIRGYKATFKTGWGPDTLMDYLYFAPLGRWTVKVRASVDSPTEIEHEREVDALVRALPWDQLLRAAGGCSGWACDTARAFPFNSHSRELQPTIPGIPLEPIYSEQGYALVADPGPRTAAFVTRTFGAVSAVDPVFAIVHEERGETRILRFYSGRPSEEQFRRDVRVLREHPERPALVSPAEAALYLGDFD